MKSLIISDQCHDALRDLAHEQRKTISYFHAQALKLLLRERFPEDSPEGNRLRAKDGRIKK